MKLVLLCALALSPAFCCADDGAGAPPPGPGGPGRGPFGAGPGGPGAAAPRPQPRAYKDVITDRAKTQSGVFKLHELDEKLFFEIPLDQLGKEFLWTAELAKSPLGSYSGAFQGDRVIRWVKRADRIFLRTVNYNIRAEKKDSIQIAVEAASFEPIVLAFDVAAYAGDDKEKGAAVIDVTRLYTTNPQEFAVRVGGGAVDANRSFLERAKALPINIEVESLLTFSGGGAAAGATPGPPRRFGGGVGSGTNSAVIHYSMVRLPDVPMMGRLEDSRVGFFSVNFQDYGTDEHRVAERSFITRFRLEKKDPAAAVSEPVKPIVFYVSREVPDKWKEAVRKGIEDWQPAFEQAGFTNAIIGKIAPSAKEDPDWSPEDARYNVVRWAPLPVANAMGPHVHDPRSGEIISAHIIFWHNILDLQSKWYFSQASPSDPKSQQLPLSDELMAELMRYVAAHEVGHTLGLQHNMKASSSVSVQQLRDPKWTKEYGTAPSIMDYARFNYVAQPGDGVNLIPRVSLYDKFAIEWGYQPIAGAHNPADEKKALDELAAKQVTNPMLRFGGGFGDPSNQSEDLGSDGVEATRLGLRNIARIAQYLVKGSTKFGEDYRDLVDRYDDLWSQRSREISHVVAMVGGVVETNYHAGRGGSNVYLPVARDRQQAAVALINEAVFKTPREMIPTEILNRITPSGALSRISSAQQSVLSRLLSESRLQQLLENEVRHPSRAYAVSELFRDLRAGIWSEANTTRAAVDVFRRSLQRAHVNNLIGKLDTKTSATRAYALGELRDLAGLCRKAMGRAANRETRSHFDDLALIIENALRPTVNVATASAAPTFTFPFGEDDLEQRWPCARFDRWLREHRHAR